MKSPFSLEQSVQKISWTSASQMLYSPNLSPGNLSSRCNITGSTHGGCWSSYSVYTKYELNSYLWDINKYSSTSTATFFVITFFYGKVYDKICDHFNPVAIASTSEMDTWIPHPSPLDYKVLGARHEVMRHAMSLTRRSRRPHRPSTGHPNR